MTGGDERSHRQKARDPGRGVASFSALVVAMTVLCSPGGEPLCSDHYGASAPARGPSPKGALLRSVVYPGWGQLANGKPYKACVIMAVEAYLAGVALSADRRAGDAAELAGAADSQAEAARLEDRRSYYEDRRNQYFWWLGATVLYSMLDAYVDAHLAGVSESEAGEPPVALEASAGGRGGVGLAIVARF